MRVSECVCWAAPEKSCIDGLNKSTNGTPFAAANVEYRGDQNFHPNYTIQAGWLWRNPTQRLGNVRVFVERYDGRSPFGQNIALREQFTSVGFGFDY